MDVREERSTTIDNIERIEEKKYRNPLPHDFQLNYGKEDGADVEHMCTNKLANQDMDDIENNDSTQAENVHEVNVRATKMPEKAPVCWWLGVGTGTPTTVSVRTAGPISSRTTLSMSVRPRLG